MDRLVFENVHLREPADDGRKRQELDALVASEIAETKASRMALHSTIEDLKESMAKLDEIRKELADEKRFTHKLCAQYHLVRVWNQLLVNASGAFGGFIRSGGDSVPVLDGFSFVAVLTHYGVDETRARALQPADLAAFEAAIATAAQFQTATASQLRRRDYGTEAAFLELLGPDLEDLYHIVAEIRGSNDPTIVVGGRGGVPWVTF